MNTKTLMMAVSASLLVISAPAWALTQGQGQAQGQLGINGQHQGQGQGQGQDQAAVAAQSQGQTTDASSRNTNVNIITFPNRPLGNATARSRAASGNLMIGEVGGNDLAQVNAPTTAYGYRAVAQASAVSTTGNAALSGGFSGVSAAAVNTGNQNLIQQNANVTFSNATAVQ